jgi:hypothetical protein
MRIFSRALQVILCFVIADSAVSQTHEFRCSKAFPEMAPEYAKLVCTGNDLMERGRAKQALNQYLKASKLAFFESPNFLIYYRIASAQSAIGDRIAASQTLKQFNEMLDIYIGEKLCEDLNVGTKVSDVMCSEAISPESFSKLQGMDIRKQIVREYRQRAKLVKH